MAQAVCPRPLIAEGRADKVALGKVSLSEFFGFPLRVLFHRGPPFSCIIWGMNRSVRCRSSETWSHPIDMKNNKIQATLDYAGAD
jgi:hypothetical protein